jgi:hypothetical protein
MYETVESQEPDKQRQTLMSAFEQLSISCSNLDEIFNLTITLNKKLNRTENEPEPVCEQNLKAEAAEAVENRNIVELFYEISYRIDELSKRIEYFTTQSIDLIE